MPSRWRMRNASLRALVNVLILAKLEESKISNDDRVEDIETEDTLTDNLKLLNKENISNVLGMHSKMTERDIADSITC